jgi:hypothetical protein
MFICNAMGHATATYGAIGSMNVGNQIGCSVSNIDRARQNISSPIPIQVYGFSDPHLDDMKDIQKQIYFKGRCKFQVD